jgi:pyruvate dehydrogenase E1 component alpha subunit
MDVLAVHEAVSEAVARARRGEGPSLVEAKTYRYFNHHGIANLGLKYRPDDEVLAWKERDPIFTFEQRSIAAGVATRDDFDAIWADIRSDIERAIEFADSSPFPEPDALLRGVYTEMGA